MKQERIIRRSRPRRAEPVERISGEEAEEELLTDADELLDEIDAGARGAERAGGLPPAAGSVNHALLLPGGALKLQATLSASSTGTGGGVLPHHPITCTSDLRLEADGSLRCEHSAAPPDDVRTQHCIDHSVSLLLLEPSSLL